MISDLGLKKAMNHFLRRVAPEALFALKDDDHPALDVRRPEELLVDAANMMSDIR